MRDLQPTAFIASFESSDEVKAHADYICDGIDDAAEINAAIEAMQTVGGRLFFSNGTFDMRDKSGGEE